jgi:NAD(P)-dependent dehydrogenase (short-subunit alcohol dehydrogenase family)
VDSDKTLACKTVLVTGGTRGLGRAMVLAFAARGADVIIVSRRESACIKLATHVAQAHGVRAHPVPGNVSDWSSCDSIAERAYQLTPTIDVLVNNAGLSPLYPSLGEVSEALFDKVIAVNLRGPFRLSAVIGGRMKAAGHGNIINISSVEAIRPNPRALPYAAAKAGLNMLTMGFAHELAPQVRVNAIQAGPFRTDISASWDDGYRSEIEGSTVLGRCGEPDEILGAVLFLAGQESSYTTGTVLAVDGGLRSTATRSSDSYNSLSSSRANGKP